MNEIIKDHCEEYEAALTHFTNLLQMETKNKLDIIQARKRLNDAKDTLRIFELDLLEAKLQAI